MAEGLLQGGIGRHDVFTSKLRLRTMHDRVPPGLSKPLARYLELELLLHKFFESTGYCRDDWQNLEWLLQ